jgi:hypothetical protein
MKKIGAFLFMLVPTAIMAQTTTFRIAGRVGHVSPPAKAYLEYHQGGRPLLDSVTIQNGFFQFNGQIQAITPAVVRLNKKGSSGQKATDRRSFLSSPASYRLPMAWTRWVLLPLGGRQLMMKI